MPNIDSLSDVILSGAAPHQRYIVAVAGPPGSGKSTLAQKLCGRLPHGLSQAVPMDGFHYDNVVLDQLGLRARKGAPESFDFPGFAALLQRIRSQEPCIAIPLFDRDADLARAGACLIPTAVKFILVEGNYLLLDEAPWTDLAPLFDLTIFLDVPRHELERRLLQRWADQGYSKEKAEHWVATNDMPNVDRVLAHRRREDLSVAI